MDESRDRAVEMDVFGPEFVHFGSQITDFVQMGSGVDRGSWVDRPDGVAGVSRTGWSAGLTGRVDRVTRGRLAGVAGLAGRASRSTGSVGRKRHQPPCQRSELVR